MTTSGSFEYSSNKKIAGLFPNYEEDSCLTHPNDLVSYFLEPAEFEIKLLTNGLALSENLHDVSTVSIKSHDVKRNVFVNTQTCYGNVPDAKEITTPKLVDHIPNICYGADTVSSEWREISLSMPQITSPSSCSSDPSNIWATWVEEVNLLESYNRTFIAVVADSTKKKLYVRSTRQASSAVKFKVHFTAPDG